MTPEEAHQALIDAAERFVALRRDSAVIVARGDLDTVRPGRPARPPLPGPGQVSGYDLAIIRSLTDIPQSSRRIARLTGRTWNSYLRAQLGRLVDAGFVRRTSRGYRRP